MTKQISQEWKKILPTKKNYFEKMHEIKQKDRNVIIEEYEKLTKKKKPATAWLRFYKKRFQVYVQEHPTYKSQEITKLVNSDWRTISDKEKSQYER